MEATVVVDQSAYRKCTVAGCAKVFMNQDFLDKHMANKHASGEHAASGEHSSEHPASDVPVVVDFPAAHVPASAAEKRRDLLVQAGFARARISKAQKKLDELGWTAYTPFITKETWKSFETQVETLVNTTTLSKKVNGVTVKRLAIARRAYRTAVDILYTAEAHMEEIEKLLVKFNAGEKARVFVNWRYQKILLKHLFRDAIALL